jgi:hypothetical protein
VLPESPVGRGEPVLEGLVVAGQVTQGFDESHGLCHGALHTFGQDLRLFVSGEFALGAVGQLGKQFARNAPLLPPFHEPRTTSNRHRSGSTWGFSLGGGAHLSCFSIRSGRVLRKGNLQNSMFAILQELSRPVDFAGDGEAFGKAFFFGKGDQICGAQECVAGAEKALDPRLSKCPTPCLGESFLSAEIVVSPVASDDRRGRNPETLANGPIGQIDDSTQFGLGGHEDQRGRVLVGKSEVASGGQGLGESGFGKERGVGGANLPLRKPTSIGVKRTLAREHGFGAGLLRIDETKNRVFEIRDEIVHPLDNTPKDVCSLWM